MHFVIYYFPHSHPLLTILIWDFKLESIIKLVLE